jgi:hypothetical protein
MIRQAGQIIDTVELSENWRDEPVTEVPPIEFLCSLDGTFIVPE